jgi:hypothetical protein
MDARRFRNNSTQRFAEFRWWGCVLLAMFALVQTARGSVGSTAPPEPVRSDGTRVSVAGAACKPTPPSVSIDAAIAAAAWDEAAMRFVSDPLQDSLDLFSSARPVGATRIASAALSDASAGDLRIRTP